MKNPVILAFLSILLFSTLPSKAQNTTKDSTNYIGSHIFTLAPLGLINKIRIRYEYVASKRMTYGAQASYYFSSNYFPGIQILGIAKYYGANSDNPFGNYIMAQLGMAFHHETVYEGPFNYPIPGSYNQYAPYNYSHKVSSYGLIYGIGIGRQRYLGRKKRLILDCYMGIRGFLMNHKLNEYYIENKSYDPKGLFNGKKYIDNQFTDLGNFFGSEFGVGGIFNCSINLGYRF